MSHVIGSRALRSDRDIRKHHIAEWMTSLELAQHIGISEAKVNEIMVGLKQRRPNAKTPTDEALKTGLARGFKHHGRTVYKWRFKEALEIVKQCLAEQDHESDSQYSVT